jgi:hypothetical protein
VLQSNWYKKQKKKGEKPWKDLTDAERASIIQQAQQERLTKQSQAEARAPLGEALDVQPLNFAQLQAAAAPPPPPVQEPQAMVLD